MSEEDILKGIAKCEEVLADPGNKAITEAFTALKRAYESMLSEE